MPTITTTNENHNDTVNEAVASMPLRNVTNQTVTSKPTHWSHPHVCDLSDDVDDDNNNDTIPTTTTVPSKPYNTRRGKRRNYSCMANGLPSQETQSPQPEPTTKWCHSTTATTTTTELIMTSQDEWSWSTRHQNSTYATTNYCIAMYQDDFEWWTCQSTTTWVTRSDVSYNNIC